MEPLLQLEQVSKSFPLKSGRRVDALSEVSLTVYPGETLGIVGESGCGKSTLAKTIMGVYPNAKGNLLFCGKPLRLQTRKARLAFAEKAQMIFQDPYTALNPRMRVEDIIAENLTIHKHGTPEERGKRVRELLREVGLQAEHAGRFPSEFSGGQRQRIGIARALALRPSLLICDEPISALDVSIQSQIMNLLKRLQAEQGFACIFIAHDLNMVRYLSSRIAVMYRGRVVELGTSDALYEAPRHPYTQLLAKAVLSPVPGPLGQVPAGAAEKAGIPEMQTGCPFAARCPHADLQCAAVPPLRDSGDGHMVACHHVG